MTATARKRRASDRAFAGPLPIRIKHARRIAGVTQASLARATGVGPSAVAQWESPDGSSPTVSHLAEIAVTCGVSFEWLATGRGAVAAAGGDIPAIEPASFAVDFTEERLLTAFRRVPTRKRECFLAWMEAFF
ncbi:helix-turn-helix transcriptional regulator [Dokdonella sp.]|uniref:helix-turn-helix domain-containing protein n=1 Tax=Dokdonella sp. TaxID=2291710 RepID=UPI001B2E0C5D|nr:helix-turn-helix transcriptional regulator [Dokdonella sp.]MBO9662900.1 helix-turn-helix transcriptional regulator [Dokdonella sp.]